MPEVGDDDSEMIKQLKEKFYKTEEKVLRYKFWCYFQWAGASKGLKFKASNYMVCKAKSLVFVHTKLKSRSQFIQWH